MLNKFFENFDKKKLLLVGKLIFVLASLVVIVNVLDVTHTRYESTADVSANANIAFFVIDQGLYNDTIHIEGLEPSNTDKTYTFYVKNNKDGRRADVDLEYSIKFETTTNLPLEYEIIRDGTNIVSSSTIRQDDNGVYYRVFNTTGSKIFKHSKDELDEYTLKIHFADEYKNYPDKYEGVIEMFSIIIQASQVA